MLALGMLVAVRVARAQTQCMWGGRLYGAQAMSCQNGRQAQCVDGQWKMTGEDCAGVAADPSGEENQPGVVQPPLDAD